MQTNPQKDRPRGRPADTGQQDLKSSILDAAENLFSEHGYAATSIRQIAEQAGVNPALIHYYFSNKKNLLKSVIKRIAAPLGQSIAALADKGDASPDKIAGLILSMATDHPNLPRLMVREVMLPGGELQQYFIENLAPNLGGALPALLQKEKSKGRLREDIDPAIAAMMILAMCTFPFIARTITEPVLGVSYDEDGLNAVRQQITQVLRHGMTQ